MKLSLDDFEKCFLYLLQCTDSKKSGSSGSLHMISKCFVFHYALKTKGNGKRSSYQLVVGWFLWMVADGRWAAAFWVLFRP